MRDGDLSHYKAMEQVLQEILAGETPTLEMFITQTCQKAWAQENNNTTVNDMIAWILKKILPAFKEEQDKQVTLLINNMSVMQSEINILKEQVNGINGRVQEPKRNGKATDEESYGSA